MGVKKLINRKYVEGNNVVKDFRHYGLALIFYKRYF